MEPEHYDVSATAVGVVEAEDVLGPDRVRPGDVVIAMASSGLHSNGYSLARHVLLEKAKLPLDSYMEELGRTLGEELLEPTRIYAKDCLALAAECDVHTFCHVTGGGLAATLLASSPPVWWRNCPVPPGLPDRFPHHRRPGQSAPGGNGQDLQHGRGNGCCGSCGGP